MYQASRIGEEVAAHVCKRHACVCEVTEGVGRTCGVGMEKGLSIASAHTEIHKSDIGPRLEEHI